MKDYSHLKVGQVITAYHTGYHIITRIEERNLPLPDEFGPWVYYKKLYTDSFNRTKDDKIRSCYSYSVKVLRESDLESLLDNANEAINRMINISLGEEDE